MLLDLVLAAPDPTPAGPASFVATDAHPLSPTGVAALLIFAFVVDYFAFLPAWLSTRLTFVAAVVAIRQGFNGGPLDRWTVERLTDVVQTALDQAKGSYIAAAVPITLVGIAVGVLSLYVIGLMMPAKLAKLKFVGRFVSVSFKETGIRKITWPIWAVALPIALFAELPLGLLGDVTMISYDVYSWIGTPLPKIVFGVA